MKAFLAMALSGSNFVRKTRLENDGSYEKCWCTEVQEFTSTEKFTILSFPPQDD